MVNHTQLEMIIRLMLQGRTYQEICRELGIDHLALMARVRMIQALTVG